MVLGWIPVTEASYGLDDEEAVWEIVRYLVWMAILVMLQTPVAGVLSTLYLGLAVFEQRPTWSSVWAEAKRGFKRWFWKLGIVRFALPPVIFLAFRWGQPANWFCDAFVPLVILLWVSLVRAAGPFMPEILLLEQCPIRSKSKDVITASRRSKSLHRPMAGDLSGRFIAVSCVLFFLLLSFGYSLIWVRGISIGRWDTMNLFTLLVIYPFALWSVAGISVMVRLLNYLDCRIRLEGWEVELAVRAEAMRQFGEEAMMAPTSSADSGSEATKVSGGGGMTTKFSGMFFLLGPIFLSLLAFASPSQAEVVGDSSSASQAVEGSIWYDAEQGKIKPMVLESTTDDSMNRNSRWLPKADKVRKPKNSAPIGGGGLGGTGIFGSGLSIGNLFGWFLLVLLLVLGVGTIMWALSKAEVEMTGSAKRSANTASGTLDEQTVERMKHLPAELRRTGVNPRSEAERLMNAGNYDQAIILLFGHQLLMLDRQGHLRLNRGKTNRRYLRECRSSDRRCSEHLTKTVAAFERSYFGRHAITAEEFRGLWENNGQLETLVDAKPEVAA